LKNRSIQRAIQKCLKLGVNLRREKKLPFQFIMSNDSNDLHFFGGYPFKAMFALNKKFNHTLRYHCV
jgi:hypothetical protein